ncbi:ABC multidrug transporter [Thozetella sp. PMI_491]|nr:ABC multidrug transporter [Thozetella sp. PMI_491]
MAADEKRQDGPEDVKPAGSDSGDASPPKEPAKAKAGGGFSFGVFFRLLFAANPTLLDFTLMAVGTVAACCSGVTFPVMGIVFGELVDDVNGATCEAEATGSGASYGDGIHSKVVTLVYIALGALVAIFVYIFCWSVSSQRLAERLRQRYFENLLRQEPSFFDTRRAGEVSSRLQSDIQAVQAGASEKVGIFLACSSFFIAAYVIAFTKEPKLAGMLVSLIPAFMLSALVGGAFVTKYAKRISDAVEAASSIASEALMHVGVVKAFSAGPRLEARFADHMAIARHAGIRKAMITGLQAGLLYFIAYAANALAYWQGSRMVADAMGSAGSGATIGRIYTVVFILVDACIVLGSVAPLLPVFGAATSAFQSLMVDIERKPAIESSPGTGMALPLETPGAIALREVSFAYPSRPDAIVLNKVTLDLPAGKHTAIVGPSGSGKSTIASLITKLQSTKEGSVLFDGHDVNEINTENLRSFVGLVQQEPSLLDRSILENIALGLVNSPHPKHAHLKDVICGPRLAEFVAKQKHIPQSGDIGPCDTVFTDIINLVRHAADMAHVSPFIDRLEHGYGTSAGPSGSKLSGGQRQRVALARALIRDPKILVLDEATASLDSASERHIQTALEEAAKDRTVVSIAHRLSTIKNADNIVVVQAGQIIEQGTYSSLVALGGVFARLVTLQSLEFGQQGGDGETLSLSSTRRSSAADGLSQIPGDLKAETETDEEMPAENEPRKENDSSEASEAEPVKPFSSLAKGLMTLARPSLVWVVAAIIGAILVGCTFTASGLIFGHTVGALNPCSSTMSSILSMGKFFSGLLFMLAVVELFANGIAWSSFGRVAERILYSVRVLSFRSLLEQEFAWHQAPGRTPSSLLSIVTKDSAALGGFSGSIIGTVFSIMVNFLVAIIVSNIFAWKIALVCLAIVPVLLGAGVMQIRSLSRFEERHAEAYTSAIGIAVEAVNSIHTVAAFSLEDEVARSYYHALQAPRKEMVGASVQTSIWLALANTTGFFIYAFSYWWGSSLIMKGEYTQTQFFVVQVSMLVSAQLWGQTFSLAPEFSRARSALSRLLGIMELGSGPDPATTKDVEAAASSAPSGAQVSSLGRGVKVELDNVSFSYPSRPDVVVINGVSLTIQPGQFIGIVGQSGAGKSTIMSLIQRLYTPTSGSLRIDGLDMSRPDAAAAIHDDIALVPQSPALFDGTVAFNVGLGARPGTEATAAEIEAACRLANIHETVAALPKGYDTECGPRAGQLSGGQRQRLAIARALVRKPRLLLLDESTSALDAESEQALQADLETAARGITVVAVTHRLRTVRKADVIFVVEGGAVLDSGSHTELMERCEVYRGYAQQQTFES